MSIQEAINQGISQTVVSAAIIKKLEQDSPRQVNKQTVALVKKAGSKEAQPYKYGDEVTYNQLESLESKYPLLKLPAGYLEAKESLAKRIAERDLQKAAVKQKRQSYLDQPTSLDLNLSPEQKSVVRARLKGGK